MTKKQRLRDIETRLALLTCQSQHLAELVHRLPRDVAAELHKAVGISVHPGVPSDRPAPSSPDKPEGSNNMAKVKVSCVKKSAGPLKMSSGGMKAAGDAFVFVDNEDSSCTVNGVDAGGNPVDITSVATLAVTSSDTGSVTVDPPTGMTFLMHGLKPNASPTTISVVATWNDGSVGPLSFDLPVTCVAGPANSIVVVPGTPVVRP